MKWTKKIPTKDGYYWVRHDTKSNFWSVPRIHKIYSREGKSFVLLTSVPAEIQDPNGYEFSGPLKEPK